MAHRVNIRRFGDAVRRIRAHNVPSNTDRIHGHVAVLLRPDKQIMPPTLLALIALLPLWTNSMNVPTAVMPDHPFARHEKLALRSATPNATHLVRYGRLEITLDLSASYENPFDPEEIDVYALLTSPRGKITRISGFLDQAFTRSLEGDHEVLTPAGQPFWRIRFTPNEAGRWRYRTYARDKTGLASLPAAAFEVANSRHHGFIGRSKKNPAVFSYSDERPYFAVGENLCWGGWDGKRGTYDYDTWLGSLGKAGANWIRVWMSSWNCGLEWTPEPNHHTGAFYGVGEYNLAHAWKMDAILDAAEHNGIDIMLCLGTYGEFTDGGFFNEGQWKANPYNVANGGPCAKPADFWTDSRARKLYRRRLRYLIARYGCRTNLHSWEFWNEANAPAPWVGEMARYLKGTGEFAAGTGSAADPYGHMVTTTYGNKEVWEIPEIDITQTHKYGTGNIPDFAPAIHEDAVTHAAFGKPHLMAEFGIDWRKGDEAYDATGNGVNLHNGIWSAMASGDAGSAMIWWWDGYVHPKNLYSHFAALRNLSDKVAWTDGKWSPASVEEQGGGHRLNAYGLTNGHSAILWIQNAAHNWKNVSDSKPIPAVENGDIALQALHAGTYTMEWWDTYKGEVTSRESVTIAGDVIHIRLPVIVTDIALRISPSGRKPSAD